MYFGGDRGGLLKRQAAARQREVALDCPRARSRGQWRVLGPLGWSRAWWVLGFGIQGQGLGSERVLRVEGLEGLGSRRVLGLGQ